MPEILQETSDFSVCGPLNRGPANRSNHWYGWACAALAVFAGGFCWSTGHRGVFQLDHSMIIDGGWRILQGQVPYRDFLMPFGPLTFAIQAFFFTFLGVNWTATVVPACLLNVAAALSAIRIVRLLTASRPLALCAGLATAISFQAPFGTLWLEQTAMFFDLLALQAVVERMHATRRRTLFELAAGVSLALALLAKHNFGILFVPLLAVVALAAEPRRWLRTAIHLGVGMAAVLGAFAVWLWVCSDPAAFVQRVFVVTREIGRSRMTIGHILNAVLFHTAPYVFQADLFALAVALTTLRSRWSILNSKARAACALAILLPCFRTFTQATTVNEWQNSFAFVGLSAALGVSLLPLLCPLGPRRLGAYALAGLWGFVGIAGVAQAGWMRDVQQFENARFSEQLHVPGMERVAWGEPTPADEKKTAVIRREDFEALAGTLASGRNRFFVMGDSTMLYGFLGVPSPQPMLYFLPSHSYLEKEITLLDDRVVSALESHSIDTVVREKIRFLEGSEKAFAQFPRLSQWLANNFTHNRDLGIYEIWQRKTP